MHVDFTLSLDTVRAFAGAGLVCGLAGFVVFMAVLAIRTKGRLMTLALMLMVAGLMGQAVALGLLIAGRL